jgi:hypothetical protein
MRVDVVESLPKRGAVGFSPVDDASVDRALRTFFAAIDSEDSLFEGKAAETSFAGVTASPGVCTGEFALRLRGEHLSGNRRLYFSLTEKLVELLKEAGSADSLAALMCLAPGVSPNGKLALDLKIRVDAHGNTRDQAFLRWGLGLAHVQQALLFTSRYLRQQLTQSG